MPTSILSRGTSGDSVKDLQSSLNKVGAMLIVDGEFGSGTERGIRYAEQLASLPITGMCSETLFAWLTEQKEPFPSLSTDGVALIALEETGGLYYYQIHTQWPHFPGYQSGITIGVGYDLRFHSVEEFNQAWGTLLTEDTMAELSNDIGRKGTKKRAQELRSSGIFVTFDKAWRVFCHDILPRYYDKTLTIYPLLVELPKECRAALTSIVFNRGTSLSGASRIEMLNIQNILKDAFLSEMSKQQRKLILVGVEEQILSMQRLWEPSSGLNKRRQREANLWRRALIDW